MIIVVKYANVIGAIHERKVDESMSKFKRVVSAMLAILIGFGLLAVPVTTVSAADATLSAANIALSREVATEGMVLLKNDNNSLPLKKGATVALFGGGQINFVKGGTGSGDVNAAYVRNLLQGMQIKQDEGKVTINTDVSGKYSSNTGYVPTTSELSTAASKSDNAIIVITRNSGETSDRSAGKGDYLLSDAETSLISNVCSAGFDNVCVVLNIGAVIDTGWISNYDIDSVLLAWQPGMEGGLAVADILVGDVNPSGKLADTFAKSFNDYPSSSNFQKGKYWDNYEEDIFVGYRWFETFDPTYSKVNYEFGFGLSYTTFSLTNARAVANGINIDVTVDVKNTGSVAGKEVVQVYFKAPQGVLGKPGKELAAFAKTDLLEPGQTETVKLSFPINDMSSYDDTGKTGHESAYVLENGTYNIYVGTSVKNCSVAGSYNVTSTRVTEQLTEQAEPVQLEKRLLADGTYEYLDNIYNTKNDYGHEVSKSGTTRIEAEDSTSRHQNAPVWYNENNTATCVLDVQSSDVSNGGLRYASFDLNVQETGVYDFKITCSQKNSSQTDSINLYVDDVKVTDGGTIDLTQTSSSDIWATREFGTMKVTLTEGKHTFRVEFSDGGGYRGVFDYFTLTPADMNEGSAMNVNASGTTKIEAESYTRKSAAVGTESVTAGDSNGATSLIGLDNETETRFVEYKLNVASAGTYALTLRASNGHSDGTHYDSVEVLVDGISQNIDVDMQRTGSSGNDRWWKFVDVNAGDIQLPAGTVHLRLDCSRFGNLDYFTLTKVNNNYSVVSENFEMESGRETSSAPAYTGNKNIKMSDVVADESKMDVFLAQMTDDELTDLLHGKSKTLRYSNTGSIGNMSAYGIPAAETADGPAGVRFNAGSTEIDGGEEISTTAWPIATLVACTWNTELVEQMGVAFGKECNDYKINVLLAPGMNIHRNPLCGRNFEYYSEDPLVSGKMAAALTRGVQSQNVAVAIKHFAGNNREYTRKMMDSRMSERALREIYLKGFEIAVKEGNAWSVMSSYNRVNNIAVAESVDLLTNILRKEWGFDGAVLTDWRNTYTSFKEVLAGGDIKMPDSETNKVRNQISGALDNNELGRADLLASAENVVRLVMRTSQETVTNRITEAGISRVRANNFTSKSSGVGSETCSDTYGGTIPNYTQNGAWLTYNIDVETAGTYSVVARVASANANATIQIAVDGNVVGTIHNDSGSTGWQDWKNASAVSVNLPEGEHTMTLTFPGNAVNLNWIEFQMGEPVLKGDADFNDVVDTMDIAIVKDRALKGSWSEEELAIADMNGDGKLTVVDIIAIKRVVAKP